MMKRVFRVACVAVSLLVPGLSFAQAPSAEGLAAAQELMTASKAADSVKAILPTLVKTLKPAIVQSRPQVERDYDAIAALLLDSFSARANEMMEKIAVVYASNFTVAEMKEFIAFYRTPSGQKLVAKQPLIMQQSMAIGQQFGGAIGRDLQTRIIEELRKKGHNI